LLNLQTVESLIAKQIGEVVQTSAVYKTAPWGNIKQPHFLNQVIKVFTNLSAHQTLQQILSIEKQMGRTRVQKWEPRIIDIDILFFDNKQIETSQLVVPHPLLHQRKFTLLPLNEIAPDLIHPKLNTTIAELLIQCSDTSQVVKLI
jgi:2-amino-4-hydroxy-6-hydroxymethyldihydropteridine diphosphokinase